MKEFTEKEKFIAKNFDDNYKWIARDKNGDLYAFEYKPHRNSLHSAWTVLGFITRVPFSKLFSAIKWTDSEPTLIRDIYDPQILTQEEKNILCEIRKSIPFSKVFKEKCAFSCLYKIHCLSDDCVDQIVFTFSKDMFSNLDDSHMYSAEELGLYWGEDKR